MVEFLCNIVGGKRVVVLDIPTQAVEVEGGVGLIVHFNN